jgi:hypothetical protein
MESLWRVATRSRDTGVCRGRYAITIPLVAVFLMSASACGPADHVDPAEVSGPEGTTPATQALTEPPLFDGRLREVVRPGSVSGQLLLEDVKWPPEAFSDRFPPEHAPREARVHFGKDVPGGVRTLLFVRRGQDLAPASGNDLRVGQRLEVWTTYAVLKSDPPQYFARQIVIAAE